MILEDLRNCVLRASVIVLRALLKIFQRRCYQHQLSARSCKYYLWKQDIVSCPRTVESRIMSVKSDGFLHVGDNRPRQVSTFVSQPNPVTGKMDWIIQDEDYDYLQEIARSGYGDMLHDTDRNVKYFEGIRKAVQLLKSEGRPVNVLDIGTGTGLLSMMAVKSGADSVTACEAFPPMAECAKAVIAANQMTDKIKLIPKRSTEVLLGEDLPLRANLLVTELFDTELIGEGAIPSYIDAHSRLMESDCVAVPSMGIVYIQAVQCETLRKFNTLQPVKLPGGRTLLTPESFADCGGAPSLHDLQVDQLADQLMLVSEPVEVFKFDFSKRDALQKEEHMQVEFSPLVSGRVDAFVMWWHLEMDPRGEIQLSCAPKWTRAQGESVPWRDHWMQALYYPSRSLDVLCGQRVSVFCSHDEYSLWFDTHSKQSLRPVCSCGLHVAFSRVRLGQMNDRKSLETYTACLKQHVTAHTNCLVISEGSLLPLLAAGLGANKVFFLDGNVSTQRVMHKILEENKLLDRVKILDKDPEQITSEDLDFTKIDVVISEPHTMAAHLPWEHVFFWYALSAMQDHLGPGVVVLPRSMKVKAMALQFRDLHKIRTPVGRCEGFDIGQFDHLIQTSSDSADPELEPQPLWEYPATSLSPPVLVTALDFSTPVHDTPPLEQSVTLHCHRSGAMNGVALWTEFDFGDGLTINHGVQDEDWQGDQVRWDMFSRQAVQLFRHSHPVDEGAKVSVTAKFTPSTGDLSVTVVPDQLASS